jgi:hypothetical protein
MLDPLHYGGRVRGPVLNCLSTQLGSGLASTVQVTNQPRQTDRCKRPVGRTGLPRPFQPRHNLT